MLRLNPVVAGRLAAAAGIVGTVGHLVLAAGHAGHPGHPGHAGHPGHPGHAGHAGHEPVLLAGMALLALVCVRCAVHLWRRPADRGAWQDTLGTGAVMAVLHLVTGMPLALLAVPVLQLALRLLSQAHVDTDAGAVRAGVDAHQVAELVRQDQPAAAL
ncbi:hypothetical protein ACQP2E_11225 [Actinoplanes sp. CA-015351]|uniref:hypothetical protein n=1 Tax=Actinoplanes sp. CA-015351 TaxID=3239897 RepID=UPI003D97955C